MKKRNLIIDLTSLLDVILIILFMVLVSVRQDLGKKEADLQNINKAQAIEIEELKKSQLPANQKEKDWYLVYNDQIGKIDLSFPNSDTSDKLKIINSKGEEFSKAETEDFEGWLIEEIKKLPQEVVIISFRYKNDAIYYRDYVKTREIIINLGLKTGKKVLYEEFPQ